MNTNHFFLKELNIASIDDVTIERFIGFLQTDGHINFSFDKKDMAFRTKVGITVGENNKSILENYFAPWLRSRGIKVVFNKRPQEGSSINLVIDRQANVLKLIALIDAASEQLPTLLVDDKLLQYNALKKALELNDLRKQQKTVAQKKAILKQIIDLKMHVMLQTKARGGFLTQQNLEELDVTKNMLEDRCKVDNTFGAANEIINNLVDKTEQQCADFVKYLQENNIICSNCPQGLQDFVLSVLEGDGSFQVTFATALYPQIKGARMLKNFGMIVTLTDKCPNSTSRHYLMDLFKHLFGNKHKDFAIGKVTNRLVMLSSSEIEKIVAFVRNKKFINLNDAKRFSVFEFCFEHFSELHKNRQMALFLVDQLSLYGS